MTILTGDIKLLKSQVNLDTTDGGGFMTADEVLDGVSNNLFPDVSSVNRTFGAFQLRKVYASIWTANTDSYYGSNVIIAANPTDANVSVALFTTGDWSDRRSAAKDKVQRYLATGPKYTSRVMEDHYAGSMLLNLINTSDTDFPKSGEAIVVRNPSGQEQYVRVLSKTVRSQAITQPNAQGTYTTFTAIICACELSQPLSFDVLGPPISQSTVSGTNYAQIYSTVVAAGARFYGTKPIAAAATLGELSVHVGDIFSSIVPSTTAESAIVDQYPHKAVESLARTSITTVQLPSATVTIGPNTVLKTPSSIEPLSLSIVHSGAAFTDDGQGVLKQGATAVGAVNYAAGTITFSPQSNTYGAGPCDITYKPSCLVPTTPYSSDFLIDQANAGLVYTEALEPPPSPMTLVVSYITQGNWYTLRDGGNGKLAGADVTDGTGTVNYTTGSVSLTLKSIPDIGSSIIFQWGDAESVVKIPVAQLPSKLSTVVELPNDTLTATLTWSRNSTTYTATVDSLGNIAGDAIGKRTVSYDGLKKSTFEPAVIPDGAISIAATVRVQSTKTDITTGSFSLAANVVPSTVQIYPKIKLLAGYRIAGGGDSLLWAGTTLDRSYSGPDVYSTQGMRVTDDGNGSLVYSGGTIGTINYTTGACTLATSCILPSFHTVPLRIDGAGAGAYVSYGETYEPSNPFTLQATGIIGYYTAMQGSATTTSGSFTPTEWVAQISKPWAGTLNSSSICFKIGSAVFNSKNGVLTSGFNVGTGVSSNATAGLIRESGDISVSQLPGDGANNLVWVNICATGTVKRMTGGVFRADNAPLKTGVFQLQAGTQIATANAAGVISGGGFSGSIDFQRGIVRWKRSAIPDPVVTNSLPYSNYILATNALSSTVLTLTAAQNTYANIIAQESVFINEISYNAVFIQNVPIDPVILGLDTARLPLDGRVPIYRKGEMVVLHHTTKTAFPATPYVGQVLNVGRVRVSSIKVVDSAGAALAASMYTTDLDAGTVTLGSTYSLGALVLPLYAEHRIEDSAVMTDVQISGLIKLNQGVTHAYPLGSMVSSAMYMGDLQARAFGRFSQESWTGVWSDSIIGNATISQFNDVSYPITTNNRGSLEESWALIFTSNTAFRVVGKSVGQIATGNVNTDIAPVNPATNAPYFSLNALGWGDGWSAGNVLRFNTAAANYPIWIARTLLQGPASTQDDSFKIQVRGDIDR